jgi:hypothetical protein
MVKAGISRKSYPISFVNDDAAMVLRLLPQSVDNSANGRSRITDHKRI